MLISVHKPNDNTYLIRPSHPAPITTLHLIDWPQCDLSDLPGIKGFMVAWTADIRPVQNNEELQVKSANDRIGAAARPQIYGSQY